MSPDTATEDKEWYPCPCCDGSGGSHSGPLPDLPAEVMALRRALDERHADMGRVVADAVEVHFATGRHGMSLHACGNAVAMDVRAALTRGSTINDLFDAVFAIPTHEMTDRGPVPRGGQAVKDDALAVVIRHRQSGGLIPQ